MRVVVSGLARNDFNGDSPMQDHIDASIVEQLLKGGLCGVELVRRIRRDVLRVRPGELPFQPIQRTQRLCTYPRTMSRGHDPRRLGPVNLRKIVLDKVVLRILVRADCGLAKAFDSTLLRRTDQAVRKVGLSVEHEVVDHADVVAVPKVPAAASGDVAWHPAGGQWENSRMGLT